MAKCLTTVFLIIISTLVVARVLAQEAPSEAPRVDFDIGGGIGFPTSTISNYVNSGANFVVGGGVRMHSDLGFNGEFSWQDLAPKSSVIAATGAPGGNARQYSVTGNMLLHTPESHKLGGYGIGGIGWYHRSWDLTAPTLAIGTTCVPSYAFWGVVCSNGLVSATQVLKSGSGNAFGWNVGGGVTYRLGESHLKVYAEARVHFAYYSGINTRVIPLTFGLRW
jgi:opacity protein-like surface antigen